MRRARGPGSWSATHLYPEGRDRCTQKRLDVFRNSPIIRVRVRRSATCNHLKPLKYNIITSVPCVGRSNPSSGPRPCSQAKNRRGAKSRRYDDVRRMAQTTSQKLFPSRTIFESQSVADYVSWPECGAPRFSRRTPTRRERLGRPHVE
jgi:hypothetical protein